MIPLLTYWLINSQAKYQFINYWIIICLYYDIISITIAFTLPDIISIMLCHYILSITLHYIMAPFPLCYTPSLSFCSNMSWCSFCYITSWPLCYDITLHHFSFIISWCHFFHIISFHLLHYITAQLLLCYVISIASSPLTQWHHFLLQYYMTSFPFHYIISVTLHQHCHSITTFLWHYVMWFVMFYNNIILIMFHHFHYGTQFLLCHAMTPFHFQYVMTVIHFQACMSAYIHTKRDLLG